jgi:site-specific recombinase XerD
MGELREKMLRRMELKNFSKKTIKLYLYHMKKFVRYYGESPERLGKDDIERYLHSLLQSKTSSSGMAQAYSAIKFFYSDCLEKPWELKKIPRPKTEKKLPVVLAPEEVKSILHQVTNIEYKTILMIIYSAGLRLSEALNLKLEDIDSKRMEIRVEQGKGKKDRYTILSDVMLSKLREYYKEYWQKFTNKSVKWLFPGRGDYRVSNSTVQRVFGKAKKKWGSRKMSQYIHFDIALQSIC